MDWLREHLCPGIATPGGSANPQIPWTHKRLLIFTEKRTFNADPIPKVVLLGRLPLYGEQATRLHDEIVAVSAGWSSPEVRGRRKLKSMGESDKKDVLQLLETSLAQGHLPFPDLWLTPPNKERKLWRGNPFCR